ncbi:MAG: alpha/beta hydrolase [Gammaproteobacteria bacterium]|nr:alpha/beta hydrolase [Gammaproteobacteria bacterium]
MARGPSLRDAVNILGPAGQLEALLEQPKEPLARKIAVLCHPHPQYQGTMLNKVVHTLARSMNDLGVPAIRFNFRGVGASEGEYAGGIGETEDTLSVIDWARDRYPEAELCLVGFSFGAMVACRAALSADPIQLVTVAPAVARMQGLLQGSQPACPWLIVQGEADEVVACSEVIQWVNGLAPGPELIVLPDVGHFFHGCLTLLRETVVSHLSSQWINQ